MTEYKSEAVIWPAAQEYWNPLKLAGWLARKMVVGTQEHGGVGEFISVTQEAEGENVRIRAVLR